MSDADDHPFDRPLVSLRLHPHRSLTARQIRVVLMVVAAGGAVASVPFYLMGAWPVVGFMGLDVLAVWIAFRVNARAARAYEDVSLTMLELMIAKVGVCGERAEFRFNPVWVRLQREDHAEFGLQRLDLVSRGQRVEVAGFLGPEQKADVADELARGLATARRGVRWSD